MSQHVATSMADISVKKKMQHAAVMTVAGRGAASLAARVPANVVVLVGTQITLATQSVASAGAAVRAKSRGRRKFRPRGRAGRAMPWVVLARAL